MARFDATLFQPDPKRQDSASARGGGSGSRARNDDDDDGPSIALGARLSEAVRSAGRRKAVSFIVMMMCGALTVLAAIFAPRSYEVESRVLVQQTSPVSAAEAASMRPEDMQSLGREYEEQVKARDNIVAIVKQLNLVARWDEMRQPHRKVLDQINKDLGKPAPTDAEKTDALVANIEQRLRVSVDATTVTLKIEWSHAEAARDIIDAAMKNFLATRFQSEVGVLPAQLAIKEGFVAQAQKNVEAAALDLSRAQKAAAPRIQPRARGLAPAPAAAPPTEVAAGAPKSVQEAQVRFDTATASLQAHVKQAQELRMQMLQREAQYKNRYKITRPAELPAGPKRSVATIAILIGILSTIAAVLAVAALADRFSGIFHEPRDVRDRIGLPVLAAFS